MRDTRAVIAIEIPEGASAKLKTGQTAHLIIYADPTKRIEADAIELQLEHPMRTHQRCCRGRGSRLAG